MFKEGGLAATGLIDVLQYWVNVKGREPAYTFIDANGACVDSVTYNDLYRRVLSAASSLKRCGVESDDCVLLVYPAGLDFISGLLGCTYIGALGGAVSYPKSKAGIKSLAAIVANVESKLVLTARENVEDLSHRLGEYTEVPVGDLSRSDMGEGGLTVPIAYANTGNAFVQLTSGSTGLSKALVVDNRACIYNLRMCQAASESSSDTVFVTWLPHYHDLGLVAHIMHSLYSGGHCVILSPAAVINKPVRWLRAISDHKAHYTGAPDFAYRMCVSKIKDSELDGVDLSSLKLAINASEPVSAETIDRFSKRFSRFGFQEEAFYPSYGMAEATVFVSGGDFRSKPIVRRIDLRSLSEGQVKPPVDHSVKVVGCGTTWLDQKIAIFDPDSLSRVCSNKIGEIWISGDNVLNGYIRDEKNTAETFVSVGNVRYLRTGDLGFIDDEGQLFVTGRIKDVVIVRGANFYPQDIEKTFYSSHECLMDGFSVAFNDQELGGELVVVAGVDRHAMKSIAAGSGLGSELMSRGRESVLRDLGVGVDKVLLVKPRDIPRTTSGKICRRKARAMYLNEEFCALAEILDDQSEGNVVSVQEQSLLKKLFKRDEDYFKVFTVVAGILDDRFGIDVTSIDHEKSLFFYGLDSINIIDLHCEIEKKLGVTINAADLFDAPSFDVMLSNISESCKGKGRKNGNSVLGDKVEEKTAELKAYIDKLGSLDELSDGGCIVLTGASGFLGCYMLASVLEQTSADVVCIVRGADVEAAERKLSEAVTKYKVQLNQDDWKRVEVIVGDIMQDRMGLSYEVYERLAASSFMVIHCAAVDNFYLPYSAISRTNVDGTMEVLKFSLSRRIKRVAHVSSCAVDLVDVDSREEDTFGLLNGYAQSKYVSENIVKNLSKIGVPATSYKLGYLYKLGLKDLEDGDSFETLMHAIVEMKKMPDIDLVFDLTPVDYAADCVVKSALKNNAGEASYAFYNPVPISWGSIKKYFGQYEGIEFVSLEDFVTDYQSYLLESKDVRAKLLKSVVSNHLSSQVNGMFKDVDTNIINPDLDACPPGDYEFVCRYLDDILGRHPACSAPMGVEDLPVADAVLES